MLAVVHDGRLLVGAQLLLLILSQVHFQASDEWDRLQGNFRDKGLLLFVFIHYPFSYIYMVRKYMRFCKTKQTRNLRVLVIFVKITLF